MESVGVVTVKLASVVVSVKVNAISRPSVVSIVLPPLYAVCNVMEAAEHFVTLSVASTQRVVPVAVVKPVSFRNELLSVLMVTPLVPSGEKVD